MKISTINLASALCTMILCVAAHAQTHEINVPGGDLKTALDLYIAQSGVQLVYKSEDVKGLSTKGVQHASSDKQALSAILDNTGLSVKRDGTNAAIIFRDTSATSTQPASADTTDRAADGTAIVTITGHKAGMGLMKEEDAPKARSEVTPEEIQKERSTGNFYQSLALLPSVNAYNYDGTGLFGGGLTLRGFGSSEVGFNINGVPVNDSGSFSVYPEEFVDQENVCGESVTQGSTDIDASQISATGGAVNINTCDPVDKQRWRVIQTAGGLDLWKTYVRYDSGRFDDDHAKFYISASHAQADLWTGDGSADRDHVDAGFRFDIDHNDYISGAILMNRMVNTNYFDPSLAQLNQYGYGYGNTTTFNPKSISPPYYKLADNPFENVIASVTGKFRLDDTTDLKILPYFWFGYGTGGTQEKSIATNTFVTPPGETLVSAGSGKDIVAGSNVAKTDRTGITASLTKRLENNTIYGGVWFEQADQRQTAPIVPVDAAGNPASIWLNSNQLLLSSGLPYESRNWDTKSTSWQLFLQDTVTLLDDKLRINFGARDPSIRRDFTNIPNEGPGQSTIGYEISRTYSDLLPQIGMRYDVNNQNQIFASLSKNMEAPSNVEFSTATGSNVTIVNGQPVLASNVKPETSWNLDVGYRYQSPALVAQATIFDVNFQNRIAQAFDPISDLYSYQNAGGVKTHGAELEIGNSPIHGWSAYGSFGYTISTISDNIQDTATQILPTAGKEYPLTPKYKVGLSLQYETPVWYVRLKEQHTSSQWATLVNDQMVSGYNLTDLDAGYLFPDSGVFKHPTLRLNISNLFNAKYLNPSSQAATNAVAVNGIAPANVLYYEGAPRLFSASLQADF